MASASWLEFASDTPFPLENIPFGVISTSDSLRRRVATAIGDWTIDLDVLQANGVFSEDAFLAQHATVFSQPSLNAFAALGQSTHRRYRAFLQELFRQDTRLAALLKDDAKLREQAVRPRKEVQMHIPMDIGDYTDFYAGINHAVNVGTLFRGPQNALQPNYVHLPVGYHGRASSIQVSGRPVRRPRGQILPSTGSKMPIFGPCRKLDIEIELAAFVCKGNEQGKPIRIESAGEHIFGYVLMNDWSARDIQAWEYVPLGPFNSKNFATTISPWVILAEAMEPFRCELADVPSDREILPYLKETQTKTGFDIACHADIILNGRRAGMSRTNARHLCFSFEQMLTHHSITGCNMRVGDLLGSGTISGTTNESFGSMLEMTANGKEPIALFDGAKRTFLEDGDEIILNAFCGWGAGQIGFGDCSGVVLPAWDV